ncbi:MAG: 4-(cytidine 5'-diphospho)-2-C-methyl-D-erythritol kinase [Nocardioides sp.]
MSPFAADRSGSYVVRAPAKLNLHLGVGAVREDGFHPLDTVYQAIGIYDDVIASASEVDRWRVSLVAADYVDVDAVPLDASNIVARAARLLRPRARPGTEVRIRKDIPVAAGMAGGSADGAAALVALDRLWNRRTTDREFLDLAARLGSDVPFALVGGTAHGTGRGELVEPVPDSGSWWWVAALSPIGLSTPEVYAHWDRLFPSAGPGPTPALPVLTAVASGNVRALARAMHNDLEAAAFDLRPDLAALVERGEAEGALRGMVTGSGPTCVFLCESADHARDVAAALNDRNRVVLVANGPVAGAHLVSYS